MGMSTITTCKYTTHKNQNLCRTLSYCTHWLPLHRYQGTKFNITSYFKPYSTVRKFHTHFYGVVLINPWPEVVGVPPEGDTQKFKKSIHSCQQGLWCVCSCVYRRRAFKHNHPVSQVCCHNEIMLYYKSGLLGM
jgi:hypothetical protein